MTKPEIILEAGKRIAATARGRAFKNAPPGAKAEDPLEDLAAEPRAQAASLPGANERHVAEKRSGARDDTLDEDLDRERREPGFDTDRGRDVGSNPAHPRDDENSNT